jgi:hypothetical protein
MVTDITPIIITIYNRDKSIGKLFTKEYKTNFNQYEGLKQIVKQAIREFAKCHAYNNLSSESKKKGDFYCEIIYPFGLKTGQDAKDYLKMNKIEREI